MSGDQTHVYKVMFHSMGQIYEVYAHNIYSSDLYGFIEVEDYIFGKRSQVVIDPGEDKLRNEFEGVQRSFIPMHAVIRIDEVEKEGIAKVTETTTGNVTPFPHAGAGRQEQEIAGHRPRPHARPAPAQVG